LEARLKKVKHVATLGANPRYIDSLGLYTNPARAELMRRMKRVKPDLELLDLRPHLSRMRMLKQDLELAAIERAVAITVATIREVTRPCQLAKYAYEYEVEADITRGFRRRGAAGLGHAFSPIVAAGERACIMHYLRNDAPLASGELLLLDIGAQVGCYAADITRTVAIGGHPSRRQDKVYQVVQEAQRYALSLLKPGTLMKDYEQHMEQFVGEKLRELGLIQTIERDTVRRYFPHATSHFLGLDTHDAGDYEYPLEPGVVVAVEPGIYIPEETIGVRIEDDVVITQEGNRVLSRNLPQVLA
jgi:Xaa-Pro aminopeptidase